jgi:homeobox-leucine zipper protein
MSFGGLFDGGGGGGMQFPYAGAFSSSPALSLGLVRAPQRPPVADLTLAVVGDSESLRFSCWQDNAGGGGGRDGGIVGRMFPDGAAGRDADAQNDSRSGSDHLDAISGVGDDDDDAAEPSNPRKRKKRYHRHTPQQIQELEA